MTEKRPNFKDVSILVLPGAGYGDIVRMFAMHGAVMAKDITDADLVVFAGGADVNPVLYGEKPAGTSSWDNARDKFEAGIFEKALALDIPMFGICRGSQFLNIMNKGKMWQDVGNHCGNHLITDLYSGKSIMASSTHHQMARVNANMNIIAIATDQVSKHFKAQDLDVRLTQNSNRTNEIELEAYTYEDTKCLCIQGHPEWGPPEFQHWALTWLETKMSRWSGHTKGPDPVPVRVLTEEERAL